MGTLGAKIGAIPLCININASNLAHPLHHSNDGLTIRCPVWVKGRCLIKFRLISHYKGISSLGRQDIPAVIVQFQALLAIRDSFLYVFRGAHAPPINSITHLGKLEFGAQVHAGIANGGWCQVCQAQAWRHDEHTKYHQHRSKCKSNTIPQLLVVAPICTTDPGWQDRTCSQGVPCNPPSEHGMLHQRSSGHRVRGQ
jgi:hypothetical protein